MNDTKHEQEFLAQTRRVTELFAQEIDWGLAPLDLPIDAEIRQELRTRMALLMFGQQLSDQPDIAYLSVWATGSQDITQVYMSPKIEGLLGYSPRELRDIGFASLVGETIISYFRETDRVCEDALPTAAAQEKREQEFIGSRFWEGCYRVQTRHDRPVWVLDKANITQYRNSAGENVVSVSGGMLVEVTDLMTYWRGKANDL